MPHKYFEQTRIRQLTLPTSLDTNKIQIGIPVDADEAMLVGLQNVGESVLPSSDFGCVSKRNACGDEYADKFFHQFVGVAAMHELRCSVKSAAAKQYTMVE